MNLQNVSEVGVVFLFGDAVNGRVGKDVGAKEVLLVGVALSFIEDGDHSVGEFIAPFSAELFVAITDEGRHGALAKEGTEIAVVCGKPDSSNGLDGLVVGGIISHATGAEKGHIFSMQRRNKVYDFQ